MNSRLEKALSAVCLALTLALAVLVVYFGYVQYYREYHAALLIVAMLAGAAVSSFLCCAFHEAGHVLFGACCGFRFHAVHVWFVHVFRSGRGVRMAFGRAPQEDAGSAEMLPVAACGLRGRYALTAAGGLLFSFLWFAAAFLVFLFAASVHFAAYALVAASLPYAFYLFLVNLIPFTQPPTDGAVVLGLLRWDASAQTMVALLSVECCLMQGQTPAQIAEAYYYGVPQLPEDDPYFILLTDHRLARAIDGGEAERAAALSDRLKGLAAYVPEYCRGGIAADVLFAECAIKQNKEEARRLYPAVRGYLREERTVSARRVAAAYALFAEGDAPACLRCIEEAENLLPLLGVPGMAAYEKKLLACLREEAEAQAAE